MAQDAIRCTIVGIFRFCVIALATIALVPHATAETIKIGALKSVAVGPVYLGIDKGYFAAEGLSAEITFFDSAQPVAVAAASRDIDFGVSGFTGGLFSLAGQGALRVIGGYSREVPGFNFNAYVVSIRAWEGGLRSYKDFAGHSFGISQIGSPPHYSLALLAEKYHFDLASVRLQPLVSIANIAAAVVGGQVDTASLLGTPAIPIIARGEVKLLGWTGDETPWQLGALFTATATANERRDTVERFLRAFRKGSRDYHDAYTGAGEKREDGPSTAAASPVIAKYTGLTTEQVGQGIVYVDPDARLDVKDVLHQIAWYRSQGLVKGDVDGDQMIDKRYVVPLAGK
jgi:NitT/TauT family transport system substrate-binding protein